MSFAGLPSNLLCNEVVQTVAKFTNCSDCHLEQLYITTPNPEFFTFGATSPSSNESSAKVTENAAKYNVSISDIKRVSPVPIPSGGLLPGRSVKVPVWIQGHKKPGKFKREVLFYYLSADKTSPKRLVVACR